MPVVWQDAVGHNLDGKPLVRLGQHALEGFLVGDLGRGKGDAARFTQTSFIPIPSSQRRWQMENYEKKGVVSIWVFREVEDAADAGGGKGDILDY